MPRVVVLRWGHRPRDKRVTTHVALTARALGASGMILAEASDKTVLSAVKKVTESWGGPFFMKEDASVKEAVKEWRAKGGIVVHLTAYGENIEDSDVLKRIRGTGKDVMVIVGSRKVPPDFFTDNISDFNVAIGNQPHSECSSLAIFLDRYFEGKSLRRRFKEAKMAIIPQVRGKRVVNLRP